MGDRKHWTQAWFNVNIHISDSYMNSLYCVMKYLCTDRRANSTVKWLDVVHEQVLLTATKISRTYPQRCLSMSKRQGTYLRGRRGKWLPKSQRRRSPSHFSMHAANYLLTLLTELHESTPLFLRLIDSERKAGASESIFHQPQYSTWRTLWISLFSVGKRQ
jgi:hypothetical protein